MSGDGVTVPKVLDAIEDGLDITKKLSSIAVDVIGIIILIKLYQMFFGPTAPTL